MDQEQSLLNLVNSQRHYWMKTNNTTSLLDKNSLKVQKLKFDVFQTHPAMFQGQLS